MTTTERDTSSLNYDILVRGQGRCGITIIGGIGSTHVVVVGIPAIKIKVLGILLTERSGRQWQQEQQ